MSHRAVSFDHTACFNVGIRLARDLLKPPDPGVYAAEEHFPLFGHGDLELIFGTTWITWTISSFRLSLTVLVYPTSGGDLLT